MKGSAARKRKPKHYKIQLAGIRKGTDMLYHAFIGVISVLFILSQMFSVLLVFRILKAIFLGKHFENWTGSDNYAKIEKREMENSYAG